MATRIDTAPVDWAGDNPVIEFRASPNSSPTTLVTYFRISTSPHGRGHVVVFLTAPEDPEAASEGSNAVFTDNRRLAEYLLHDFVTAFRGFRDVPGITRLPIKDATGFRADGDGMTTYSELATSEDGDIELTWKGLGQPFWIDFMADPDAGRVHDIHSLFVPAASAVARVGAVRRTGIAHPRIIDGHASTLCFLAFGEVWIRKTGRAVPFL